MPNLQVRVVECLFATDTLLGVETKHLGKKIDGQRVRVGEEGGKRYTRSDWERTYVLLSLIFGVSTLRKHYRSRCLLEENQRDEGCLLRGYQDNAEFG